MTEAMLVTLIMQLCGKLGTDVSIQCFDKYVNCAIIKDGQILTKEEFEKKCLK